MKNIFGHIVFLIVGIGFLIGTIAYYNFDKDFKSRAVEVDAVISNIEVYKDDDGETTHRVYVTFEYGGQKYENVGINFYYAGMKEGKTIELLCDPNNPTRISSETSSAIMIVVFLIFAVTFSGFGIKGIVNNIKEKNTLKQLSSTGHTIYATVDEIIKSSGTNAKGQHSYVVRCSYMDDYNNTFYEFESDEVFRDPSDRYYPGCTVKVQVQPEDYSLYHVILD